MAMGMAAGMRSSPAPIYRPAPAPMARPVPVPTAPAAVPAASGPARFYPAFGGVNVNRQLLDPYNMNCANRSLAGNHPQRGYCDQLHDTIQRVAAAQPPLGQPAPQPPQQAFQPGGPATPIARQQPSPAQPPRQNVVQPAPAYSPPAQPSTPDVDLRTCLRVVDTDKGNSVDVTAYNNCPVPVTVVARFERPAVQFGSSCNAFDVRVGSSWTVNFLNFERARWSRNSYGCYGNQRCSC